ncbi:MAG: hypothetical protein HC880_04975 [Bacteroidia bacterium]|nr:hypothetical protein [Bacteroidia bacterium]
MGGTGCSNIIDALTIQYNARQENLGSVTLSFYGPTKPGQTVSFAPISVTTPEVFGEVSPIISPINNVNELLPCAYTVFLSVTVKLTNGNSVPGVIQDFVSFCIARENS